MRLFSFRRKNGVVAIHILHKRPGYPENVKFLHTYTVKADPKLDFKNIFFEAFSEAHPDWPILEINLKNEG